MQLQFTKMNGAGNDFVLIDNRDGTIRLSKEQVMKLCHRQRGVGADGVFLLMPDVKKEADWAWEFFNSDGSEADMCGNGARCFARYIQRLTSAEGSTSFRTGAGIIKAKFDRTRVTINLTPPHSLRLDQSVTISQGSLRVHYLNTGVPHIAVFVPSADQAMVQQWGRELRYHQAFAPSGTNVNFVQVLAPNSIRVRTYERGVEGETLACGTGVTAAALISALVHKFEPPINVQVEGGDTLQVSFQMDRDNFSDVRLSGPAEFVFEGRIEL